MEIKTNCYKGTKITIGNEKFDYLENCRQKLIELGYTQISIPNIQLSETFKNKVGVENNNMMFQVKDRSDRELCLSPEYTAVIQQIAKKELKQKKDVKLFYIQECFRGEKPQKGRYRQFTQLGVEIVNPSKDYLLDLSLLSMELCELWSNNIVLNFNGKVARGLDYYKENSGFEIECEELGSQKQICGGGSYEGGIGFALGIDRIVLT